MFILPVLGSAGSTGHAANTCFSATELSCLDRYYVSAGPGKKNKGYTVTWKMRKYQCYFVRRFFLWFIFPWGDNHKKVFPALLSCVCPLYTTIYLTRCELPLCIKPQPYGRFKPQVTFRAAFMAVTAALQSERARACSPLQSAWRTHRKSTLAGRPGGKDRALSTRTSEPQTERAAIAEWMRPGQIYQLQRS